MAKLFISPHRDEDWTGGEWKVPIDFQIEPDELAEAIKGRWPEAEVRVHGALDAPVEWQFPSVFNGYLQSSLDTVAFSNGPEQSLLEFGLWFRTYVTSALPSDSS